MIGRRVAVVAGLMSAALVVPAGPAQATVTVTYVAATHTATLTSDAASDTMIVSCVGPNLALSGVAINPVVLCVNIDVLNVNGGGGNDILDTTAFAPDVVNLDGGDGNDSLTGLEGSNPNNTVLNATGGPGNDVMKFVTGDSIAGGDGDDLFPYLNTFSSPEMIVQGQGGTDTYQVDLSGSIAFPFVITPLSSGLAVSAGGPGASIVPWNGIEVIDLRLTDGAETVRLGAFPGRGRIEGRGGNDTLLGGDGDDTLLGGPGNDTLEGGAGTDSLDGSEGDDILRSRDVFADAVVCGAGTDIAVVDGADSTNGCETKDEGSGTDAIKPKPKFSGAKVKGSKLTLKAACPANELRCVGEATLSVKGKHNGANRGVKLGRVLIVADGGRKDRITLALTPAQRSALQGLTKAKLTIAYDVIDAAGNIGKGKKTIKLKI